MRLVTFILAVLSLVGLSLGASASAEPISVYAAGSLRAPLTELATGFTKKTGLEVRYTFGASGLLKERIEKNEPADIFASANTEHPAALASANLVDKVRVFARNEMCALVSPKLDGTTSETLLKMMLDPAVKLGTSTPKADPSGDYAFQVFDKVAAVAGKPASEALKAKALQLTGGRDSPPPTDRNVYGELLVTGKADIFLTYCTNAALAIREQPTLKRVALPASLAVSAEYGLTLLKRANPDATKFADYLLADEAQQVLVRYGFVASGFVAAKSVSAMTAQGPALARLSIELPSGEKREFKLSELEKLSQRTASVMIRDKGPFVFSGVPVFAILEAAGYQLDSPRRGAYLTQYVVLTARDGYRAVYSMGEFDPKSKREAPLLVWQQDGAPLKAEEGFFRLVIPDNVHTSRWIRQVEKISVRQVE
jgi:molybdate transport system substrate-binding protein